jgi:hypothetical protein
MRLHCSDVLLWAARLGGVLLVALCVTLPQPRLLRAQTAFTVNATGDAGDAAVGDGLCDTGAQTPGGAPTCTLRAAVEEANHDADLDTLRFDTLPRNRDGLGLITPEGEVEVTEPVYLDGATAPSHDVIATGDLRQRIDAIETAMPGPGSEGFTLPTPSELDAWNALIGHILDGDIQAARSVIEQQVTSYVLIRFHDTVTDQPYWLLRETSPIERGWGAVVVNPTPDRDLAVEVPHPVFDLDTHTQGADLFRFTGARVLVLAGTHRCANSASSGCDGQTSVCGEFGPYRVSDMAHFVEAPFQEVHRLLAERFSGLKTLNLHGNGDSSCETVFLSDGVENTAPPLVDNLRSALVDRGVEAGTPETSTCPLEGTTNVQGRYTNGSPSPCTTPASETVGTFVHVEQRRGFRGDPDEYQALIDAVNEVVSEMPDAEQSARRSGTASKSAEVEGPVVTIDGSSLSAGTSGVVLSGPGAAGSVVQQITVINAPASGLRGHAADLTIRGNYLGLRPTGEAAPNGHAPGGARAGALDLEGPQGLVAANVVSGNASAGVVALGAEGVVRDNIVGAGPELQTILPNAGTGLVVGGAGTVVEANVAFGNGGHGIRVEQSGGVQIGYGYGEAVPEAPVPPGPGQGNVLAQNDSSGVLLATGTGIALRGNSIYGNGRGGIRTADACAGNDDGDVDEGINRGQNVPLIEQTTGCDDGGTETTVDVQYRVRSTADSASASNYGEQGLHVDFYGTPDGQQQGKTYLGSDWYPASDAGQSVTTTLTAADVACTDSLVATATDADGNTSQFAAPTVLPVRLAAFAGRQEGPQTAVLRWTTAAEQDNAGFRVEHERGFQGWTSLGWTEGGGTRTDAQTYRFTVDNLGAGLHRFRLVQVDLDGTTRVHGPIAVRLRMREALRLARPSPNPASETATVSFAVQEGGRATVAMYNALGQRVRRLYDGRVPAETTRRLRVPVSDLASGVYFLRLRAGGQQRTRRLTVVH